MLNAIDPDLLTDLCVEARGSERRRAHRNLHSSPDDPTQRLLIALQPGTYVAAHCHPQAGRWELLARLRGALDCLVFDDVGRVLQRLRLDADGCVGMEFAPGTWHSLVCLAEDSVILEVKPGPYVPAHAAEFAPWCPREGTEQAPACADWMLTARVGELCPFAPISDHP